MLSNPIPGGPTPIYDVINEFFAEARGIASWKSRIRE
jgi:hypothetical protein